MKNKFEFIRNINLVLIFSFGIYIFWYKKTISFQDPFLNITYLFWLYIVYCFYIIITHPYFNTYNFFSKKWNLIYLFNAIGSCFIYINTDSIWVAIVQYNLTPLWICSYLDTIITELNKNFIEENLGADNILDSGEYGQKTN